MPQAAPAFFRKNKKEADQPGQLLFMLGSLARCGHAVVQHGLQGLPVLQGAAGQGCPGQGRHPQCGQPCCPCRSKGSARPVRSSSRPRQSFPAHQRPACRTSCRKLPARLPACGEARRAFSAHCSRDAAAITDLSEQPETPGPQPRTRLKGGSGAGDGEDGVLVKIAGVQAGGVGPGGGIRQVFAGSSGRSESCWQSWALRSCWQQCRCSRPECCRPVRRTAAQRGCGYILIS